MLALLVQNTFHQSSCMGQTFPHDDDHSKVDAQKWCSEEANTGPSSSIAKHYSADHTDSCPVHRQSAKLRSQQNDPACETILNAAEVAACSSDHNSVTHLLTLLLLSFRSCLGSCFVLVHALPFFLLLYERILHLVLLKLHMVFLNKQPSNLETQTASIFFLMRHGSLAA